MKSGFLQACSGQYDPFRYLFGAGVVPEQVHQHVKIHPLQLTGSVNGDLNRFRGKDTAVYLKIKAKKRRPRYKPAGRTGNFVSSAKLDLWLCNHGVLQK
jgi:hypothetical protein